MDFAVAQRILSESGTCIDAGLTVEEFAPIENTFSFHFPPDLRQFLTTGLPSSSPWIDWRRSSDTKARERLVWPLQGICRDIEKNDFWLEEWGQRPARLTDAIAIAARAVSDAPVLIPIFGHRYIPATPSESGNPIFSVYQTDIIYYGVDLLDYLHNEFRVEFGRDQYGIHGDIRSIPFWSRLVERNGDPP
jgi:hypothetical protein